MFSTDSFNEYEEYSISIALLSIALLIINDSVYYMRSEYIDKHSLSESCRNKRLSKIMYQAVSFIVFSTDSFNEYDEYIHLSIALGSSNKHSSTIVY
jgi:hypothetical protein